MMPSDYALTQITNSFAIDTSAVWSADGSTLYFTSDRGGKPQIYQVPAGAQLTLAARRPGA